MSYPETWDDLLALGAIFESYGLYPLDLDIQTGGTAWYLAVVYVQQTTDREFISMDGDLGFTVEDIKAALDFYKSLEDNHVIRTVQTRTDEDGNAALYQSAEFISGKIAGVLEWGSAIGKYESVLDEGVLESGSLLTDGSGNSGGWMIKPSLLYAISADTEYPNEAAEFMDFLLNNEQCAEILETTQGIPASSYAFNHLSETSQLDGLAQENSIMLSEADTVNVSPYGAYTHEGILQHGNREGFLQCRRHSRYRTGNVLLHNRISGEYKMSMKKKRIYHNPVGVRKSTGLLLIAPFIAGFLLFTLYPFVSSLFSGLKISKDGQLGPDNFIRIFHDKTVIRAAAVTLKYAAVLVPLKLIFSLLTAMLLNMEIKGIGVFRTIFYIPSILGANLSVVIMWQYLFTSNGLVNQLLELINLSPVSWYWQPNSALAIVVLLRLWEFGSTMVIFLAALRDIPKDYYDAASIDSCGRVRAFFRITLPLLKNVIFINLVLQTISAFQEFSAPYMITGGNPMKSTYTIGMLIYNEMFSYMNPNYANAVSWLLFIAIGLIIFIMYKLTSKFREANQ